MLDKRSLVTEVGNIINEKYGKNSLKSFLENIIIFENKNNYPSLNLVGNKTPSDQIKDMNIFWWDYLCKYENTTMIRLWLCDCDDINVYLHSFKTQWLPMINELGLFSNE